MYTELTHIEFHIERYVNGKAHMMVVYVIFRLEITKLSYIENVML
jgi:hypothetical protein